MSILHTLLEKLHLARHADVFDPAAVAQKIEDEFKKAVADQVSSLTTRMSMLEERFGIHEQAKAKDAHEVPPALPSAQTSAAGDGRKEPGEAGQVHAAAEHTHGEDGARPPEHSDNKPDGHGG